LIVLFIAVAVFSTNLLLAGKHSGHMRPLVAYDPFFIAGKGSFIGMILSNYP